MTTGPPVALILTTGITGDTGDLNTQSFSSVNLKIRMHSSPVKCVSLCTLEKRTEQQIMGPEIVKNENNVPHMNIRSTHKPKAMTRKFTTALVL